ncbi:MAG: hypothetical protein R3B70_05750 [Polyangiaceae bacterium]
MTLLLPDAPPAVLSGAELVFAVVDDGMPAHNWQECRTDNNTSDAESAVCEEPQ